MLQENKIIELKMTNTQKELINEWIEDSKILLKYYLSKAQSLRKQNRLIGIISAILSAVVGSSIFISLGDKPTNNNVAIITGLISLSATILTSVLAFLKLPEIANQCHNSGNQYAEIRKDLELLLVSNQNLDIDQELNKIKNKWDDIRSNSIPTSDKIMKKYKNKL